MATKKRLQKRTPAGKKRPMPAAKKIVPERPVESVPLFFERPRVRILEERGRSVPRPIKKLVFFSRVFQLTIKLLTLTLGVFVVGTIAAFLYFSKDLPSPEKFNERRVVESTKILDRTGEVLLYDIHGEEKRTVVPASEIAEAAKNAAIAVEDANFYNHLGIEPKAILRAAYLSITGKSLQGGSTITQQLVRNTLITQAGKRGLNVGTVTRKLREIILAVEIEQKYRKDEILAFYLNQIPYGANAYGIEAASQTYFGKPARDLTLAEAAVLAAIPKAPSYYSPFSGHRDALKTRQEFVLGRMRSIGLISEPDYQKALTGELTFAKESRGIKAPHFVFYVREKLASLYGERYLEEGGLVVRTTLDWELQQLAETLVKKYALRNEKMFRAENAALVAIDPKTGHVLAMAGSRDYFDEKIDGNVNVTLRPRQPGSAFKPFAYATVFGKGYTPSTMLFDLETNFSVTGAEPYIPKNYDETFRGPVSMRQALAQSLNVPSVKTLYLAGIEDTIRTAETLGITTLKDRSRFGLSLVLGGGEVTLTELTGAYAGFANDGLFNQPEGILSVADRENEGGAPPQKEAKRVIDQEIARQVTGILSDNEARAPVFGTASALWFGEDLPVAAKTGTTQDNRDAWVVGYTPTLAVGVWVGNNDNRPMSEKGAGISAAGPLWNEFMKKALERVGSAPFVKPLEVVTGKQVLDGSFANAVRVRMDKISGKRATDFTPSGAIVEQTYGEVHTILFYVNKDDPRGPAPEDPTQDPQFWNWAGPVEVWVSAENVKGAHYNERAPELYDDIHIPGSLPTVFMTAPQEGSVVRSRYLPVEVAASGAYPAHQVEFFFDNRFVGVDRVSPFAFTIILPTVLEGNEHTVTARYYDSVENQVEALRRVRIESPDITIVSPSPSPLSGEESSPTLSSEAGDN